jgi:hypothetical protein
MSLWLFRKESILTKKYCKIVKKLIFFHMFTDKRLYMLPTTSPEGLSMLNMLLPPPTKFSHLVGVIFRYQSSSIVVSHEKN